MSAKSTPPALSVTQPFVIVKSPESKLASPKSLCAIPVAFALVLAAFMFNLLCTIAAVDETAALSILPAAKLYNAVVEPAALVTVTAIALAPSAIALAISSNGPSSISAVGPLVTITLSPPFATTFAVAV